MMNRLATHFQNHQRVALLVGVIIVLGVFLRVTHFSDWLLFEIDQTYDTRIVSQAVEQGIENLPLLGPTAGGGRALRLGPAFYYMEYASAKIFGDTPPGHAMLVLICSILAIPLFFIFIRKYFDTRISLALITLFSCSAYLVLYGRFSWSPNVLPFFILLSLYSLLRSVSEREARRDRWFLIATTAIMITSQIHFNAFFTVPTIAVLFLLYKRPKFKIKTWGIAIGIALLVYSPMILSDAHTHGENIRFFLKKISKTGSPENPLKGFFQKTIVDLQYTASGSFLVYSGIDHISGGRLKGYGFQPDEDLSSRIFALILFLAEIAVLAWNIRHESSPDRKNFLILIFLSTLIPFLYFYSLISGNFQIYPRFYLLIAPIAIILFGLLLEKIAANGRFHPNIMLFIITLSLLIPNVNRLQSYTTMLAHPILHASNVETEDIFPNNNRLTLQEELAITDYLAEKQQSSAEPIYLKAIHEYEPVFWYHLSKRNISYSRPIDENHLYAEGNYYLITFSGEGMGKVYSNAFTATETKTFGVLTVYTLQPKPENIKALRQDPRTNTALEQTTQIQGLATWKTLLKKILNS